MRSFSRVFLCGGLALILVTSSTPAQQVSEIVRGVINNIPSDMFDCRIGRRSCDLGYRIYSAVNADEVNCQAGCDPAPGAMDGNPRYGAISVFYLADSGTTANFPTGSGVAGADWYNVWDGITDEDTANHSGWYGGMSQKVFHSEIGNSVSFTCQPVTTQEACFASLVGNVFNDATRADGSALEHVGGISPVPIPQVEHRTDAVALVWPEATNVTVNDEAANPVGGYAVYWMPANPAATQADWEAGGILLDVSSGADNNFFKLPRGEDPIVDGSDIMAAIKIRWASGVEGRYFSGNSRTFTLDEDLDCQPDTVGDTSAVVDIEAVCVAVRKDDFGNDFLVVLLDIVGNPSGQVLTSKSKYTLKLNNPAGGVANRIVTAYALNAVQSDRRGGDVVMRFNTNFGAVADNKVSDNSNFDESPERGWIRFGIPLAELEDAFNNPLPGAILFNVDVRIPGFTDQAPDAGDYEFDL